MSRCAGSLLVLLLISPLALGQTPSPLAAYDETVLRQAGVGTDAASLLKYLRDYTRGNGDAKRIHALIEQLGDNNFEKRQHAVRDLIAVGRPALDLLRKARKSAPDAEVRRGAAQCIDEIENAFDANVLLSAARRLIHLRAGGAAEPLLALLPEVDWQMQDDLFHGLPQVALRDGKLDPALLAALDDPAPLRRAVAALTVALAGTDGDRNRVRKRLTDADAHVRLRAAQGLLAVHDPAALPALIALLDEPLVEISWSAEELLHWAAGDAAPAETVGGATAAERKKAVAAWTAWHQQNAAKLDWQQLDKTPRRPGLLLLSEGNRVWLCGCDGKRRWSLPGSYGAHDFVLLPNNELVVAPLNGDGYLLKCDLKGKEIWKHTDRNGDDYVACQRLPNGHFFAVTPEAFVAISATGQALALCPVDTFNVCDAWTLRNGRILCLHDEGLAEISGFNGSVLRGAAVENTRFNVMNKFAVLPDGRCVVADYRRNRLVEIDADGKTLRTLSVRGAWCVEALRNGHYLVSTMRDLRVIEVDSEGRTVWEVATRQRVNRVRAVLDKVRIGFDKPRPADYNLDSVATRLRGLKDPDDAVRRRAAEFLAFLKPTDDAALDALIAALDDGNPVVRTQVAATLADIGAPALPRLREALKKGTDNSRLAAVGALFRMGADAGGALAELVELLRDDRNNSALRSQAAATIGRIGPEAKAALPDLLAALKGEDDAVRKQAAPALVAVAQNDAQVVAGLVAAMKDGKHPEGRLAALDALRYQGAAAKAAIPDLLALVKAPDSPAPIRQLAMDALGRMGPEAKDAVPPLLDIVKDAAQPLYVRCGAAQNLGRFGEHSRAALPVFSELLRDPKLPDEVMAAVLKGLAAMGKDGVPALAEAVKEGSALKRRTAINQLVELADDARAAIPALQEAAKDKDPNISRLAGRAIRLIEMGDQRPVPKR